MESGTTAECSRAQMMKASKPVATPSVAPVLCSGHVAAPLLRLGRVAAPLPLPAVPPTMLGLIAVARCRRPTAHRAAACPSRRSASPAAAAGSCPTSVGLARVAPAAALLEPSGERETNRTIGREELREEIKGRRRERKREKNKGKKEKKERIR
jgi:hypothetical protein